MNKVAQKPKDLQGKFISQTPFATVTSPQEEILKLKKAHKTKKPDREVTFYDAASEKVVISQHQGNGIVLKMGENGKLYFLPSGMAMALGHEIMMAGAKTKQPKT